VAEGRGGGARGEGHRGDPRPGEDEAVHAPGEGHHPADEGRLERRRGVAEEIGELARGAHPARAVVSGEEKRTLTAHGVEVDHGRPLELRPVARDPAIRAEEPQLLRAGDHHGEPGPVVEPGREASGQREERHHPARVVEGAGGVRAVARERGGPDPDRGEERAPAAHRGEEPATSDRVPGPGDEYREHAEGGERGGHGASEEGEALALGVDVGDEDEVDRSVRGPVGPVGGAGGEVRRAPSGPAGEGRRPASGGQDHRDAHEERPRRGGQERGSPRRGERERRRGHHEEGRVPDAEGAVVVGEGLLDHPVAEPFQPSSHVRPGAGLRVRPRGTGMGERREVPGQLPGHSPWRVTTSRRDLGRLSKSTNRTCCQVPRRRRPAATGTVSEGPRSAARTWECPLPSPHRWLCA